MSASPRSRFRLIDGVVVAAVGLLGLKVLGFLASAELPPESPPAAPPFARVIAHARSNFTPPADGEPTTTGSVSEKKAEAPPPTDVLGSPPAGPASPSERALLQRLGERRDELQQRSRDVEERERLIEEQERRLDERLKQASAGEENRKAAPGKTEAVDPALRPLVVMYEAMKPKDAARVFERLPLDVLVPVVGAMNARKMSEVLAAMSSESAEKLTIALARRPREAERGPTAPLLPPGELPAVERPGAAPPRG